MTSNWKIYINGSKMQNNLWKTLAILFALFNAILVFKYLSHEPNPSAPYMYLHFRHSEWYFCQTPLKHCWNDAPSRWMVLMTCDAQRLVDDQGLRCHLAELTILLLNTTCPVLANSVDLDQLASEANWSGSAMFIINYVNFYQKHGSSNLIGWKL